MMLQLPRLLALCVALLHAVAPSHGQAFSYPLSQVAVKFAAMAYCHTPDLVAYSCSQCQQLPGFTVTHTFFNQATEIFGFAGHSDQNKTIVYSFRGTQNVQNAVEDFTYPPTEALTPYQQDPSGKSQVELGFYTSYQSIQPQVLAAIQYYNSHSKYKNYYVGVTGHSLGAALGNFAAIDNKQQSNQAKKTGVVHYTYGNPRVGNAAFVSFIQGLIPNLYRTINASDPVPRVPPRMAGQTGGYGTFDYDHPAHEVWFQRVGTGYNLRTNCQGGEDPTCSLSEPYPDLTHLTDHLTYNYMPVDCTGASTTDSQYATSS